MLLWQHTQWFMLWLHHTCSIILPNGVAEQSYGMLPGACMCLTPYNKPLLHHYMCVCTPQDWGPAFIPAGVSGGVELVGFDRATLIGEAARHAQKYSLAWMIIGQQQAVSHA